MQGRKKIFSIGYYKHQKDCFDIENQKKLKKEITFKNFFNRKFQLYLLSLIVYITLTKILFRDLIDCIFPWCGGIMILSLIFTYQNIFIKGLIGKTE